VTPPPARAPRARHRATLAVCAALAALALLAGGVVRLERAALPGRDPPNVLLIVIDTLGARHVGNLLQPAPERSHTPEIDALASRSAVFTNAFSPAPWTRPAIASLFTGRMPSRHGVEGPVDRLAQRHATLAEELAARGFATGAITSQPLLRLGAGYRQGFASYDDSHALGRKAVTARAVTDASIAWLDAHAQQRFFLLAYYFDPHDAYQHHEAHDLTSGYAGPLEPGMEIWKLREQRARFGPEDVAYLVGLYREEIAQSDAEVGRLLRHLGVRGLERDTLVVLTADHGEELMEHGWIGHMRTLYDELLHVPLVVSLPGRIAPRRIETPVSLVDVVPTILAIAGMPPRDAEGARDGVSLVRALRGDANALADRALYAEVDYAPPEGGDRREELTARKTALVGRRWKLVHDLPSGRFELYDRERDPGEQHDLWGRAPEGLRLRRKLLAFELTRPRRSASSAPSASSVDAADLARLRELGYLR
jgi:arylsulfatase A-like enzyme